MLTVIDDSHIEDNLALLGADVFNDGDLFQDNTSTIGILDGFSAIPI